MNTTKFNNISDALSCAVGASIVWGMIVMTAVCGQMKVQLPHTGQAMRIGGRYFIVTRKGGEEGFLLLRVEEEVAKGRLQDGLTWSDESDQYEEVAGRRLFKSTGRMVTVAMKQRAQARAAAEKAAVAESLSALRARFAAEKAGV